jgi:hypothetical protein
MLQTLVTFLRRFQGARFVEVFFIDRNKDLNFNSGLELAAAARQLETELSQWVRFPNLQNFDTNECVGWKQ